MPYSRASANRLFAYALSASLALHAFVLAFEWPQLRDALRRPVEALTPIVARLVEPPAPPKPAVEEKALPAPPPAAQAPSPPPPRPKPRPEALRAPSPRAEPAPQAIPEAPPPAPAPAPAPIPQVAKAAPPGPPTKPLPAPPPTGTAAPDLASLVDQYRAALLQEARRYKDYPPAAVDNGWEGEVVVRMAIGADGSMTALSVKSSSGHAVLDRQALEMFRKARPQVRLPEALRGKAFSLELRAVFDLRDQGSG